MSALRSGSPVGVLPAASTVRQVQNAVVRYTGASGRAGLLRGAIVVGLLALFALLVMLSLYLFWPVALVATVAVYAVNAVSRSPGGPRLGERAWRATVCALAAADVSLGLLMWVMTR